MKRTHTYRLGQFVHRAQCVLDASPASPEPIENGNVNVSTFEISTNNRVNFNISWLNPDATFGKVASYEVIVAKYPLMGQDSVESSGSVIFSNSGMFVLSVSRSVIIIKRERERERESINLIYQWGTLL